MLHWLYMTLWKQISQKSKLFTTQGSLSYAYTGQDIYHRRLTVCSLKEPSAHTVYGKAAKVQTKVMEYFQRKSVFFNYKETVAF